MTETPLCRLEDIPENGMTQIDLDGKAILVCRAGGKVHAVEGTCPHRGAQLAQGTLEGTAVVCPWHDWAFDVETGCGITNPTAPLKKYAVTVREGVVYMESSLD